MNKRSIWIFLLVFTVGVMADFALSGAVRKNTPPAGIMAGGNNAYAGGVKNEGIESGYGSKSGSESGSESENDSRGESENESRGEYGNKDNGETSVGITENLVPAGALSEAQAYPKWDKNTTYTGGSKALYNGKIYRAKWWTLGEIPGQADVWEDTLETPVHAEPARESAQPSQKQPRSLKVVGYYPDWKGYQPQKLQFDQLTHVVYAFAIPTAEGGLRPLDNPDTASRLIANAHANQVKALLAVGGWSYNGTELESVFVSATSTSERTRQFGDHILTMCDEYGFDGVDIDWEHPRMDGASKDQYQELMLYLADQLHAKGKVLTSAVISGVSADGNIYYDAAAHSDAVLKAVDWIHVMAYDGGDGERHSSYDFAVNCADYWRVTRKVPAEKVVLGVPFYGRPGWAGYGDILAADPDARNKDHAVVNGIDAYYNGPQTMEQKAAYAKEHLGGIIIWELTQDTADRDKSLLSAIGRGIR